MDTPSGGVKPRAKDPRPARTETAILDAIETLERSGDQLTVSNIVRQAGISRSSFYTYFRDLDAVAVHLIANLFQRIEALDETLRPRVSGRDATEATITMLLDEIENRRHLYAAVLGSGVSGRVYRELLGIFAGGARLTMSLAAPEKMHPDLAAHFIAAGTLAAITWWVTQPDPLSRASVHEQLLTLYPSWIAGGLRDNPDHTK